MALWRCALQLNSQFQFLLFSMCESITLGYKLCLFYINYYYYYYYYAIFQRAGRLNDKMSKSQVWRSRETMHTTKCSMPYQMSNINCFSSSTFWTYRTVDMLLGNTKDTVVHLVNVRAVWSGDMNVMLTAPETRRALCHRVCTRALSCRIVMRCFFIDYWWLKYCAVILQARDDAVWIVYCSIIGYCSIVLQRLHRLFKLPIRTSADCCLVGVFIVGVD